MTWLFLIQFVIYLALFITAARYLSHLPEFKHNRVTDPVTVSVIIPCRNEESDLPALLKDLSVQDYPENCFEVIVVDDHSTDNTLKVAGEFTGIRNLKVLSNSGKGKKSAIRTGVLSSGRELIITTDADCRAGKSWIGTIASFYGSFRPDMIIGPVRLADSRGLLYVFQQLEWLGLQGITAGFSLAGKPVMCNGANLAFTRKTYLENSENLHYRIPSGDDIFLLHSVKSKPGSEILWLNSSDAVVTTEPAYSVSELLKQRARWISKAGLYSDALTVFLSAIVFITVSLTGMLFIASFLNIRFLPVFLAGFIIKSAGDAFLIKKAAKLRRQKSFLQWLIPLQILYPFYLAAILLTLITGLVKVRCQTRNLKP